VNWDTIFFVILPYVALAVCIVAGVYRAIYRPFTISSMSSQLLERKKLFWGSIPFHWGIVLVLMGHLAALLLPRQLQVWNSAPIRLYLLEATGLALALWALAGLGVLLWRRLSDKHVRVMSTPMDVILLLLLLVSVITGVLTATVYRFGSSWFTTVFTPYLWSVLTFRPLVSLVAPLPWVIKLHVLNFFVLLAVLPFSRLIHIAAYPIGYLFRPWQIVIWNRRPGTDRTTR
jgi:nitrate reductase gamma subunit